MNLLFIKIATISAEINNTAMKLVNSQNDNDSIALEKKIKKLAKDLNQELK